jgi:hypothetical protein
MVLMVPKNVYPTMLTHNPIVLLIYRENYIIPTQVYSYLICKYIYI